MTGEPTVGLSTVAEAPPWEAEGRPRPTWGLAEGDEIAPGRTVLRRLGGGQRYEVFLVWDDHWLAVLVAKILRPDQVAEVAALRDLGHEAAALARLAHPVIVRGFDAVTDGPMPHLLIEHLEGPTLRALIEREGALAAEQALPLGLHVASALHYLAAEGMVHLDVKPENVVMGAPPRLIDLSVARPLAAAARLRGPVGTDAYMAPEQCAPERLGELVGPPADVWGLGATLHHAFSGSRPFPREKDARDSDDPLVRFPQLSAQPEPLPERAPERLRSLLESMLERNPANRPTASEVAAALEPSVAELPRKMAFSRRGSRVW